MGKQLPKQKVKFGSFGRERDIEFIETYDPSPDSRARRIAQTNAAHDLNDGKGDIGAFLYASREAIFEAKPSMRDDAILMLTRFSHHYPECLTIWDELAQSSQWGLRFEAACRLYWYIPDQQSDRLFNTFRFDRSKKVREIAIDRYQHRFDDTGELQMNVFDPDRFDDRIRRGEVNI